MAAAERGPRPSHFGQLVRFLACRPARCKCGDLSGAVLLPPAPLPTPYLPAALSLSNEALLLPPAVQCLPHGAISVKIVGAVEGAGVTGAYDAAVGATAPTAPPAVAAWTGNAASTDAMRILCRSLLRLVDARLMLCRPGSSSCTSASWRNENDIATDVKAADTGVLGRGVRAQLLAVESAIRLYGNVVGAGGAEEDGVGASSAASAVPRSAVALQLLAATAMAANLTCHLARVLSLESRAREAWLQLRHLEDAQAETDDYGGDDGSVILEEATAGRPASHARPRRQSALRLDTRLRSGSNARSPALGAGACAGCPSAGVCAARIGLDGSLSSPPLQERPREGDVPASSGRFGSGQGARSRRPPPAPPPPPPQPPPSLMQPQESSPVTPPAHPFFLMSSAGSHTEGTDPPSSPASFTGSGRRSPGGTNSGGCEPAPGTAGADASGAGIGAGMDAANSARGAASTRRATALHTPVAVAAAAVRSWTRQSTSGGRGRGSTASAATVDTPSHGSGSSGGAGGMASQRSFSGRVATEPPPPPQSLPPLLPPSLVLGVPALALPRANMSGSARAGMPPTTTRSRSCPPGRLLGAGTPGGFGAHRVPSLALPNSAQKGRSFHMQQNMVTTVSSASATSAAGSSSSDGWDATVARAPAVAAATSAASRADSRARAQPRRRSSFTAADWRAGGVAAGRHSPTTPTSCSAASRGPSASVAEFSAMDLIGAGAASMPALIAADGDCGQLHCLPLAAGKGRNSGQPQQQQRGRGQPSLPPVRPPPGSLWAAAAADVGAAAAASVNGGGAAGGDCGTIGYEDAEVRSGGSCCSADVPPLFGWTLMDVLPVVAEMPPPPAPPALQEQQKHRMPPTPPPSPAPSPPLLAAACMQPLPVQTPQLQPAVHLPFAVPAPSKASYLALRAASRLYRDAPAHAAAVLTLMTLLLRSDGVRFRPQFEAPEVGGGGLAAGLHLPHVEAVECIDAAHAPATELPSVLPQPPPPPPQLASEGNVHPSQQGPAPAPPTPAPADDPWASLDTRPLYVLQCHLSHPGNLPLVSSALRSLCAARGRPHARFLRLLSPEFFQPAHYDLRRHLATGARGSVVLAVADADSPAAAAAAALRSARGRAAPVWGAYGGWSGGGGGAGPLSPLSCRRLTAPLRADETAVAVKLVARPDDPAEGGFLSHVLPEVALLEELTFAEAARTHSGGPSAAGGGAAVALLDYGVTSSAAWLVMEFCEASLAAWRRATMPLPQPKSQQPQLSLSPMPPLPTLAATVAAAAADADADSPSRTATAVTADAFGEATAISEAGGGLSAPQLRTLLDVWSCTAERLSQLHAAGVAHNDVKGDNVLLREGGRAALACRLAVLEAARTGAGTGAAAGAAGTTAGDAGDDEPWRALLPFVCFADFGDAAFRAGVPASQQQPAPHAGTECTRAPEQLLLRAAASARASGSCGGFTGGGSGGGAGGCSTAVTAMIGGSGASCDAWALGCFLFELVAGGYLFDADADWPTFFLTVTAGGGQGRGGGGGGSGSCCSGAVGSVDGAGAGVPAPMLPLLTPGRAAALQAALPAPGLAARFLALLETLLVRAPAARPGLLAARRLVDDFARAISSS